jgi:hypothetical protein
LPFFFGREGLARSASLGFTPELPAHFTPMVSEQERWFPNDGADDVALTDLKWLRPNRLRTDRSYGSPSMKAKGRWTQFKRPESG